MTPENLHAKMIQIFDKPKEGLLNTDFETHNMIEGPGFFPYCNGSFNKSEEYGISQGGILVLGQDWGSRKYYARVKEKNEKNLWKGEEGTKDTFKEIKYLIIKQNWKDVFLSNLFMGLRTTELNIGENPEILNVDYLQKCKSFLEIQLEELKPKYIIVLGTIPFKFIAQNTNCPIRAIKNFKEYYKTNKEIITYKFKNRNINLLVIPHISNMRLNWSKHEIQINQLFKKIK